MMHVLAASTHRPSQRRMSRFADSGKSTVAGWLGPSSSSKASRVSENGCAAIGSPPPDRMLKPSPSGARLSDPWPSASLVQAPGNGSRGSSRIGPAGD